MYRNRSVKGFVSPLIVQSETSKNEISKCQEKVTSELVSKPFRSNSQILKLFEKATQESEIGHNNFQVENDLSRKREASVSVCQNTSADLSETTAKNDLDGNTMGRTMINFSNVTEGSKLIIGNKQIEIVDQMLQDLPILEKNSKEIIEEPLQKKFKSSTRFVSKDDNTELYEKKESTSSPETKIKTIFNVIYGKVSSKKHKTWDDDGFLEIIGKSAILKDLDDNIIGKITINPNNVMKGSKLIIGNKQIEIIDQMQDLFILDKNSEAIEEPLQKNFKTFTRLAKEDNNAELYKEEKSTNSPETKIKTIFNVMYGKISSKKHKTWDGDGLLEVTGKSGILKDLDGNIMGRTIINSSTVAEGFKLIIGNKQIEIINQLSQEQYVPENNIEKMVEESRKKVKVSIAQAFTSLQSSAKALNTEPLVMPYLNSAELISQEEHEVSVDSCLVTKLREHQRYGIVFLYECLMGLKVPDHFGAILADEMGLGKTLQCITLIWTMLKKGPYGRPIVKRVLIITPSSLCSNWEKEFVKWLGSHRIFLYIVNGKNRPKDFIKYPRNSVMIISYEMFIKCHIEIDEIAFDLIVCDEGHRLKNSNVKAAKLLREINCKKRIILTGTPIQNDLKEFYVLIDLVNPGILGTSAEYKNYYENPIVASQCPYANDDVVSLGTQRSTELYERTKSFILRRTQRTINKYLPHKYEIVLFCSLSDKQKDLYSLVTDVWFNKICIEDKSNIHLTIITALKKICNHPNLFLNNKENTLYNALLKTSCISQMKYDENFTKYCGKVTILQILMRNLKKTDEKLVLVSYYTQTLDLLETICNIERLKFLRLDGATSSSARSKITEKFNTRTDNSRVLLLSAKAGGVGLNLPGASRLVLFDSDWNPASDIQAMSRIWRDGQKRDVYIYRLLTTGTIEEKIYQRQISKANLSEAVMDLNHLGSLKLSAEELKNLFTLANDTISLTHDLMNCSCFDSNESLEKLKEVKSNEKKLKSNETRDCQFMLYNKSHKNLTINQLQDWQHYKQPIPSDILQDIMLTEAKDNITFIFKNSTMQ
ncbi:DNA repair and recombination protein RAD54B-like isoform X2 [Pogonomyrmex barbatus]|uniref:DNA repair and recombination protein RAD54-like n=1 Tax=Pogonomyrmex barbatus TaxID=144034 RepID=A0A8N1S9B7_9HYME|nr:DNA repair and recombination protein RAD54B-like isoform X2 [Pogonomyrmex barbatus]